MSKRCAPLRDAEYAVKGLMFPRGSSLIRCTCRHTEDYMLHIEYLLSTFGTGQNIGKVS